MSSRLLEQLEKKIDDTLETMQMLRLQLEELEQKNSTLEEENRHLSTRHSQWEDGLHTLLNKLDDEHQQSAPSSTSEESFEQEEANALI